MSTTQFSSTQHVCPRCGAPIQIGQRFCANCSLPLDPASLQTFYVSRQQAAGPQAVASGPPQRQARSSAPRSLLIALSPVLFCLFIIGAIGAYSLVTREVSNPSNSTAARDLPISISSTGGSKSDLFLLSGGDYQFTWAATPDADDPACYLGGELKPSSGGALDSQIFVNEIVEGSKTGHSSFYNLKAGRYYFDMDSTCDRWTVTIQPQ